MKSKFLVVGLERGKRSPNMNLVRRSDVNDIHIRGTIHRLVILIAIDFRGAPLFRAGSRGFCRSADRGDLNAEAFESFNVDGADESGANDTGRELM